MSNILVKEAMPGASAASAVMSKLRQTSIQDVQLFYDPDVVPYGMWAVVQVQKRSHSLILPTNYNQDNIQPYIMWWCKTNDGHFRVPNEQDLSDIIAVVTNGRKQLENDPTGEKMARRLDEQSAAKDAKHHADFRQKIKDIAPEMKKAVQKELT